MSIKRERELLFAGLAIEALLLAGRIDLSPAADAFRWIALLVAAGAVHFAASLRAARKDFIPTRRFLQVAFLGALLFRVTLLTVEPTLSDDVYRNIWDGRVQAAGINPFAWPPTAPELEPLRDDSVWPGINHPHMRTVYPPVTLLAGRLTAELAGPLGAAGLSELTIWKLIVLLMEMGGAALLLAGLVSRGRGGAFIVYGWSPLIAFEFYTSGHADGAGVGLLAGAVGLLLMAKPFGGGALFAASVLVKPLAAPLILAGIGAKRRWKILAGAVVTGTLLTLPYLSSGPSAFESLRRYQSEWEFNGVIHRALHVDGWAAMPGRIARGEWGELGASGSVEEKRIGRLIAAALPIAAGGAAALAGAPPSIAAIVILGGLLMILPTIHPWYLTWLLPLLTWREVRGLLVWFVTIPLVYQIVWTSRTGGGWVENRSLQIAAFAPVLLLLGIDLVRALRRRRRPGDRDGTDETKEKACIEV